MTNVTEVSPSKFSIFKSINKSIFKITNNTRRYLMIDKIKTTVFTIYKQMSLRVNVWTELAADLPAWQRATWWTGITVNIIAGLAFSLLLVVIYLAWSVLVARKLFAWSFLIARNLLAWLGAVDVKRAAKRSIEFVGRWSIPAPRRIIWLVAGTIVAIGALALVVILWRTGKFQAIGRASSKVARFFISSPKVIIVAQESPRPVANADSSGPRQ